MTKKWLDKSEQNKTTGILCRKPAGKDTDHLCVLIVYSLRSGIGYWKTQKEIPTVKSFGSSCMCGVRLFYTFSRFSPFHNTAPAKFRLPRRCPSRCPVWGARVGLRDCVTAWLRDCVLRPVRCFLAALSVSLSAALSC